MTLGSQNLFNNSSGFCAILMGLSSSQVLRFPKVDSSLLSVGKKVDVAIAVKFL